MNKSELVSAVAENSEADRKTVEKIMDATFSAIMEALAGQQEVRLVGFGTFKVTERQARQGRNPATGETISIAASKVPSFKAGKAFKARING